MKPLSILAALAAIAACTDPQSAPTPPTETTEVVVEAPEPAAPVEAEPVAPEPVDNTMPMDAFYSLHEDIYYSDDPVAAREEKFTELLESANLSDLQIGIIHYSRGVTRGIHSGKYELATKACALNDLMQAASADLADQNRRMLNSSLREYLEALEETPPEPGDCDAPIEEARAYLATQ